MLMLLARSGVVATGGAADAHDAGPQAPQSRVVAQGGAADAHDAGPEVPITQRMIMQIDVHAEWFCAAFYHAKTNLPTKI